MDAGREMDALIAEKVMGERREIRLRGETNHATIYSTSPWWQDGHQDRDHVAAHGGPRPYSTDIAAAWHVMERMREAGWGEWLTVAIVPLRRGTLDGLKDEAREWEVVGVPQMMHCHDPGIFKKVQYLPTGFPEYGDMDDDNVIAFAATAPHAICLAALRTVAGL